MASFDAEVENLGSLARLTQILDTDNDVLKRPFGEYASLWEWTLQQEHGEEVASHILENRGWLVPINTKNPITGDSVITNCTNRILRPEIFKKLLSLGEDLDYISQKTGDSFLHALARQVSETWKTRALSLLRDLIEEKENPTLEVFVFEEVNFPDPDYRNMFGKTALNIAMQNRNIDLAHLLVEKLGANWAIRSIGDFPLRHLLYAWKARYEINSNNYLSEVGNVCTVCSEALNVPEKIYSMQCCGKLIHVGCFRTYLARSSKPLCIFCNMLIGAQVRRKVPQTIYKNHWRPYITQEAIKAAAAAMARTTQRKLELVKKREARGKTRRFNNTETAGHHHQDWQETAGYHHHH